MRRPARLPAILFFVALPVAGCGPGRPAVTYQPGDQNVPAGQTREWLFDADAAGGLPRDTESFGGEWQVVAEADAPSPPNALLQSGTAAYPALVLGEEVYGDLAATVRFKPVSGRDDQAAGLIFRLQDRDNYYILRANALENNVNLYVFAGGRRGLLKEGSVSVPAGRWQELKVEVTGDRIRGFLDGTAVVEATDGRFRAGRVGLWTKADSVTCFDNFRATAR